LSSSGCCGTLFADTSLDWAFFLGCSDPVFFVSYSDRPAFVSRWHLESLAVLVPSILFFLWSPGLLLNQRPNLPKRTFVLLGLLTVLTVVDCVIEWKYGVVYRGARHTILVYVINAMWLASLWWTVVRCQRQPSFVGNLFSHWLLFAWLAWYAFPYLGELP
jgi:hypothetical protein